MAPASSDPFLAFADLIPVPLLLVNTRGACLAANRAAGKRLGLAGRSLQNRPVTDLLAGETEEIIRYLHACARTREPVIGQLTLRCADGMLIPCRAEGAAVIPASAQEAAVIQLRLLPKADYRSEFQLLNQRIEELTHEVAGRKRAEYQLRQQKEWLRVVLSSIGDAVIAVDVAGRILFMNPVAQSLTGWTIEEAEHMPLDRVFTILQEQTRESQDSPFQRVLQHGSTTGIPQNTVLVSRQGREHAIADSASPIRDTEGNILGVVLTFRDVSEERRIEERNRQHLIEIESLNARLQRAMQETHHRIKNNLQVLSALLDMMTFEHKRSLPVTELQRIGRHIRSLALIHDMLTAEVKKQGDVEFISIKEALEKLLPVLQGLAGKRSLQVTIQEALVPVRHGTALAVLVNELINNAIKYGRGPIALSLQASNGQATLEVCDDGPGFPQPFDPHQQAHIGLELVESVSRWDLHGEIRYENRPEGGARVAVVFPLLESPAGG